MDTEVNDIDISRMDYVKQIAKRIAFPTAVGVGWVVAAPLVISAVGFTVGGVAAGSAAAATQSAIGNVAAGSLFASLQSAGVLGLAGSTKLAVVAAGGIAGEALKTPIKYVGKKTWNGIRGATNLGIEGTRGACNLAAVATPKIGSATLYVGSGIFGGVTYLATKIYEKTPGWRC